MGNRAVIAFGPNKPSTIGIYLHWNGGPESVLAFLNAAKQLGVSDPLQDDYGIARIAQVIGNFFGGTSSVGLNTLEHLDVDNDDNGAYEVGDGFTVKGRFGKGCDSIVSVEQLSSERRAHFDGVLEETLKFNQPTFSRKD